MKIVYICLHGLYMSGWSYHENILAKYHRINGDEITVIASEWIFDKSGKIIKLKHQAGNITKEENGTKIVRLRTKGLAVYKTKLKRFAGLYETLVAEGPDLIFVHDPQLLDADIICKYVKENMDVRLITDSHCDYYNSATNWISRKILHGVIWKHSIKMLEKYTEVFYAGVPARMFFLKEVYGVEEKKIRWLPYGADDELVKDARNKMARKYIRDKYHIGEKDILLLTGGKIDSYKLGILELMKAVIELNKFTDIVNKRVRLMVFGSVQENIRPYFEELALSEDIIYVGWIESEQMYDYFEASDLVMFPTLHSVLWEQAVGAGKPCVFRGINGFHHIDVGGNCCFFDGLSSEKIKSLLIDIIKNNKIQEMKIVAEEKGMKIFSSRAIASMLTGKKINKD